MMSAILLTIIIDISIILFDSSSFSGNAMTSFFLDPFTQLWQSPLFVIIGLTMGVAIVIGMIWQKADLAVFAVMVASLLFGYSSFKQLIDVFSRESYLFGVTASTCVDGVNQSFMAMNLSNYSIFNGTMPGGGIFYQNICSNTLFGVIIVSPLVIYYVWTVLEWWRGRD
jgi:hypothetical protein